MSEWSGISDDCPSAQQGPSLTLAIWVLGCAGGSGSKILACSWHYRAGLPDYFIRNSRLFFQKSRFGRSIRPIFTFYISHNFLFVLVTKRDIAICQHSTILFTISPYKHENHILKTDAKLLDSFTCMLNVITWHWYRSVKEEKLFEICTYVLTAC